MNVDNIYIFILVWVVSNVNDDQFNHFWTYWPKSRVFSNYQH